MPQFVNCPIHQEPTTPGQGEPDADWKERFAELRAKFDDAERVIPVAHNVEAYEEHDRLWVDHNDLYRAGLRQINRMGPSFVLFELDDGQVYETQGWDEPGRRWWVEVVDPGLAEIEVAEPALAE